MIFDMDGTLLDSMLVWRTVWREYIEKKGLKMPEELVGKTVVAVTNLPPRKMMGQESNGMLLSAEKDEKLNLLMLDDSIPAGAKLC